MEKRIICEFCQKSVSIEKLGMHLKNNHTDCFENDIKLTRYFFMTKENLSDELVNIIINDYNDNSVDFIEKKYNIKFRQYVKNLGLHYKTISDSKKSKGCIEKGIKTCREKYGVDNPSQNEGIKEKKRNTFIKNYGVDNIWKTKEYRIWWEAEMLKKYGQVCLANLYGKQNWWGWKGMEKNDKEIRINRMLDGYNNWYDNLSEDEKNNYNASKSRVIIEFSKSNLEKRIEDILMLQNIYYKSQFWIKQKSYDFYLGGKILLEIQGTYWHCDNRFYKENDIVQHGDQHYIVYDVWKKDNEKKIIAESYGYKLFYLWEYDINNMTDIEILETIKKIINENKVY